MKHNNIFQEYLLKTVTLEFMLSEFKEDLLRMERDMKLEKIDKTFPEGNSRQRHEKKKEIDNTFATYAKRIHNAKNANKEFYNQLKASCPHLDIEHLVKNMVDLFTDFNNNILDSSGEKGHFDEGTTQVAALLQTCPENEAMFNFGGKFYKMFVQKEKKQKKDETN